VVLVTIQYRMGALGSLDLSRFPTRDLAVDSNRGMRDLIRALEWVRDEIGAFGGDPAQVTLFGESSGAMAVGTLLGAPAARGLFHRAILQSGAAHNVSTPEQGERVAATFLDEVGLGSREVGRLAEIPLSTFLEAQQRTTERLAGKIAGTAWQPQIDGDLIGEAALTAIARGHNPGVDLLVGTNRDEMKFWGIADGAARKLDEAGLERRLIRSFAGSPEERLERAREGVRAYRQARSGRASTTPSELWFAIESDRIFRVPAIRLLEAHERSAGTTYSYLFTWPSPAMRGWLGAPTASRAGSRTPGSLSRVTASPCCRRASLGPRTSRNGAEPCGSTARWRSSKPLSTPSAPSGGGSSRSARSCRSRSASE
jgi:para-nitrobenzyl esterase